MRRSDAADTQANRGPSGRSRRSSPGGRNSRDVDTGYGNSSLPLLAPDGNIVAARAPFGSFGVKLWTLP
jgi:hypothetical protein